MAASNNLVNKKKVLICEDDRSLIRVLDIGLRNQGYEIFCAENGSIALDILNREKFDAIITDISLPIVNGFEILTSALELEHKPALFIITGQDEPELENRARFLNVKAVLKKPFVFHELTDALMGFTVPEQAKPERFKRRTILTQIVNSIKKNFKEDKQLKQVLFSGLFTLIFIIAFYLFVVQDVVDLSSNKMNIKKNNRDTFQHKVEKHDKVNSHVNQVFPNELKLLEEKVEKN